MSGKLTVLVVDDIALMRLMLGKFIRALRNRVSCGGGGLPEIEIIEAPNGREAIEKLQEHTVNLIFLDLMMPVMDGLTFLKIKKDNPQLASIPVIVCSGVDEKDTITRAKALGVRFYITKPFTLRGVEEKLREVIPHLVQNLATTV